MEPFPPFQTPDERRAERKALLDVQLANIKAFTESSACSDQHLGDISIQLAVITAAVTKTGLNIDTSATRVSTVHPYPQIPSGYARGMLLIRPSATWTGDNKAPKLLADRYILPAETSRDIADAKNSYRRSSMKVREGARRDRMIQTPIENVSNGTYSRKPRTPRPERRIRLAADKVAQEEPATAGMFGNLTLRVRKKENRGDDGDAGAGGMDME